MQTISDLTKDIAKKRQDKERSILEQDESVMKQLLSEKRALLINENKEIENITRENQQAIQQELTDTRKTISKEIQVIQGEIKQLGRFNMLKGTIWGVTGLIILILAAVIVWQGKEINDRQQELDELNLQIEQTPLEKRILRAVEFHEDKDNKAYFIVAKNSKKAEAYTTTGKDKVLKIEK